MIKRFTDFIKKHALFATNHKILAGVSGGMDSMALIDLLYRTGFHFGIAHCNFMLRGNESDLDEQLVRKAAASYGASLYVERTDAKSVSDKGKISIEMAARNIRYDFYNKIVAEQGYDYVATAHHLGDTLETIILNLVKGAGISGVRGIKPKRGRIVRPMLFADREMIRQYVQSNGLQWREDQSNTEDIYQRNLIRLHVTPRLLEINPNLYRTLERTTTRLRYAEKVYQKHIGFLKDELTEIRGKDEYISKNRLSLQEEPSVVLFELLNRYGFTFEQCDQAATALNHTGAIFLSREYRLNIDRDWLIVSPLQENSGAQLVIHSPEGRFEDEDHVYELFVKDSKDLVVSPDPYTAVLDLEKLQFPLRIKRWAPGDKFIPLGMKGKKKLSDFMIDKKIPLNLKERVKTLTSATEIAWAVGLRIDDRFKITPESKKALVLTAIPK